MERCFHPKPSTHILGFKGSWKPVHNYLPNRSHTLELNSSLSRATFLTSIGDIFQKAQISKGMFASQRHLALLVVVSTLVILISPQQCLAGRVFHPEGMYRVHKSIGETIGCKSSPSIRAYSTLNKVCDDCYHLYRDPDLYNMCRSNCFGSEFFMSCMDSLLTTTEAKMHHASLVENIHEYLR